MPEVRTPRYAARLNAFGIGAETYFAGRNKITILDLIERAGTVEGLNAADLNYPDHFADAAQVLVAVLGLEAQIRTEPVPNIVPVEHHDLQSAPEELLLHGMGEGRFTGTREPREPEHETLVAVSLLTLQAADLALVPIDVVCQNRSS